MVLGATAFESIRTLMHRAAVLLRLLFGVSCAVPGELKFFLFTFFFASCVQQ